MPPVARQPREPAAADPRELLIADAEPMPLLPREDERKHFRVVFQLGAGKRWRKHGPGRWLRHESQDLYDGETGDLLSKGYVHRARVHEATISGAELNGLLSEHNAFLDAVQNRPQLVFRQAGRGEIRHPNPVAQIAKQVLVISFEPTDEPLDDSTPQDRTLSLLTKLVEQGERREQQFLDVLAKLADKLGN